MTQFCSRNVKNVIEELQFLMLQNSGNAVYRSESPSFKSQNFFEKNEESLNFQIRSFDAKFIDYLNDTSPFLFNELEIKNLKIKKNNSLENMNQSLTLKFDKNSISKSSRSSTRKRNRSRDTQIFINQISSRSIKSIKSNRSHKSMKSNKSNKSTQSIKSIKKGYRKMIVELRNGNKFIGIMEEGELKRGKMMMENGTVYDGDFYDGQFHGQGTYTNLKGNKYIAQWVRGKMSKNGVIIYTNGEKYIGDIKNFKKHGNGILELTNGCRYQGQFLKGEVTGFGTYFRGQLALAEGLWKNGVFLGQMQSLSEEQIKHNE